jgi:hypothetical protein
MTSGRLRRIEFARGAWGVALLVAPQRVLQGVHRVDVDTKSIVTARILGARQLTQATLSGFRPSPEVLAMGVWVDTAHALTALGLAVVDRPRARAGLTDAAVAGVWAAAGYCDLVGTGATPPARQRRRDRLARMVLRVAPGGHLLLRQAQRRALIATSKRLTSVPTRPPPGQQARPARRCAASKSTA